MFCSNCGEQMPDDSAFCPSCGTKVAEAVAKVEEVIEETANEVSEEVTETVAENTESAEAAAATAATTVDNVVDTVAETAKEVTGKLGETAKEVSEKLGESAKKAADKVDAIEPEKKKKYLGIGVAAVVCVVVICALVSILGATTGYKGAVRTYFSSIDSLNAKKFVTIVPSYYLEYTDTDKEDAIEDVEEIFEDLDLDLEDEYGRNVKVKYEIRSASEFSRKDLKNINERYEDVLDKDITKGYEVKVKITVSGKDDSESNTTTLNVVKYKGKWYITNFTKFFDIFG